MIRPDYDRYGENLTISLDGHILTLTLSNPEKLNANTEAMHWSLSRIWDDIDADPDVRVVIFTGAGDRAFSAGGDPAHMLHMSEDIERWFNTAREAKRIIYGMLACDKPIIARLNGHAIGFGSTLALASDLIVGVAGAKFGDPHCSSGLVCGDGGALLWPQQIGYALAKEFLYTGKIVKMEEAAEMRLINYAVPRDELDTKVMELARSIAKKLPALAVTLATLALYRGVAQVLVGDDSRPRLAWSRDIVFPEWFVGIHRVYIPGTSIPLPLVLFVILAIVLGILLHKTTFGRWVYAIGTNEEAARYAGVPTQRVKLAIFTMMGLLSGLAGLIMVSRLSVARYDHARGWELDVITAVVLGGTSIYGGRGTIFGTVTAFLLIIFLRTGMGVANVKAESQLAVIGSLLIVSILLSNLTKRIRT